MTSATYALVNLEAVRHNVKKVREYAPNSKVMAVIKANAYGHGLLRIAKLLEDADALAVARVDEGIRLRKAHTDKKIIVLEGFVCAEELDKLVESNLDVVIHSVDQIQMVEKFRGNNQMTIWLKLDTGMNRLGINAKEFAVAYRRLLDCSCVQQPISFMTHLSSADDLDEETTLKQIDSFNQSVKNIPAEKSMANSAAIIAWPDTQMDWVRPGIMIYGVSPFNDKQAVELGLKPVMSLHSRLISVKDIEKGEAVGYAGTWVSEKNTRLGVIAIGYGDGYPRYAKAGTPVLVNGKRVPLVGRVSMDMITVDLSNQLQAKPGDEVTLWGEGLAVEEIAKCADTIPYTLLCGVTQRVMMRNA